MKRSIAALLIATLAGGPRMVVAAESPATADDARELFRTGLALEAAGEWGRALESFRQVAGYRSTPQVRFHVARCLDQLGRWTEAVGEYEVAAATAAGPDRDELVRLAREAIARLRNAMPTLTIEGDAGATVLFDEVRVAPARIGTAMPVDPGPHRISATSDGLTFFDQPLMLQPGERRTLTLPPAPARPSDVAAARPARGGFGRGAWVAGGAAVLSAAAAGTFALLARNERQKLEDACGGTSVCPASARPIHDAGERYTLGANVSIAVAGTAIVVAAVLAWLGRDRGDSAASTTAESERQQHDRRRVERALRDVW